MATSTTHYGLRKPDTTDFAVVGTDLNANWDDIDTELKRVDDYTSDRAVAFLRQATVQSIPNNTFTSVTFDAEDLDTESGHDVATNNSRYTVQAGKAGLYRFGGMSSISAAAAGGRSTRWAKNGAAINGSGSSIPVNSATHHALVVATPIIISLAVGDYVELQVFHSVGAAQNTVVTAENQSCMAVDWLRPA